MLNKWAYIHTDELRRVISVSPRWLAEYMQGYDGVLSDGI